MSAEAKDVVGFEATALELDRTSGVSQYAGQLLSALVERGEEWRYVLLSSRAIRASIPGGVAIQAAGRVPNRSLWLQLSLPRIVSRLRPRLCHFTNSIAPLSLSCPYVVTVHDMSLFLFPRLQPRRSLWLVRSILPAVARKAAAVITVSRSAKADIVSTLGLPPAKVHVVHLAADANYRVMTGRPELDRAVRKYGLDSSFILSVGTIEPRKNLCRLVSAFASLRRRGRREKLVLVGQLGWHYRPLLRLIENGGLKDSVRMLGYVPAADLPAIYNAASVLAYPSLYEGFGLPIVEAMACGTPVLAGDRSSMAEVSDGAALLIDPMSEDAIEQGLFRLLSDESLRLGMRAAGHVRAAQFSWARAAAETSAIYQGINLH
jgi:glycosyltransferase involved in cell wall biosynthesis